MENELIDKLSKIYCDFTGKIDGLLNRRKDLLKSYRERLEEAKIKEIRDSLLKQ